jgi:hypothetical protein
MERGEESAQTDTTPPVSDAAAQVDALAAAWELCMAQQGPGMQALLGSQEATRYLASLPPDDTAALALCLAWLGILALERRSASIAEAATCCGLDAELLAAVTWAEVLGLVAGLLGGRPGL